ncbi:MAG: hypothetical protein VR65_09935 [Desulfobulbaceae bacterium BRH_c16a]|nr:MAG: hypothetical protein VR65_09935 [Desulfobulbaceae bacterium BRH_c16a]
MRKKLTFSVIFFALCQMIFNDTVSSAEQEQGVEYNYQDKIKMKRDDFYTKRDILIDRYNTLAKTVEEADAGEIGKATKSKTTLLGKINLIDVLVIGLSMNYILYIVLSIKKERRKKSKKIGAWLFLVLVLVQAHSIAYANNKNNIAKESTFQEKLIEASKIVEADNVDKAIMKLERKKEQSLEIPDIKFSHPLASPQLNVGIDSPDYFYALAALNYIKNNTIQVEYYLEKFTKSDLNGTSSNSNLLEYLEDIINYRIIDKDMAGAVAAGQLLIEHSLTFQELYKNVLLCMDNGLFEPSLFALEKLSRIELDKHQYKQIFDVGIVLCKIFVRHDMLDRASQSIDKLRIFLLSQKLFELKDLIELAQFCHENNQEDTAKSIIIETAKRLSEPNLLLELAEMLFLWGEKKLMLEVIDIALDKADSSNDLMTLIWFSIEKKENDMALAVAQTMLQYYPNESESIVPSSDIFSSSEIPVKSEIKLLSLMGLLYSLNNNQKVAQSYFEKAVEIDIDRLIRDGGFDVDININDMFFLLQSYLEANDSEMIVYIDHVYTFLENTYLAEMQRQIDKLQQKYERFSADAMMNPKIAPGIKGSSQLFLCGWAFLLALLPWAIDYFCNLNKKVNLSSKLQEYVPE